MKWNVSIWRTAKWGGGQEIFFSFFFLSFSFFLEVSLIYNVVLVSGVQQSDSAIYIYIYIYICIYIYIFQILFGSSFYRVKTKAKASKCRAQSWLGV